MINGSPRNNPYVLPNQYVAPIVFEENFSLYDEQSAFEFSAHDYNGKGEYPQISWISDNVGQAEYLKRWSINNLVQFETCKQVSGLTIDQPSLLVKVECRKPGCRCVLKNEPALAMKIVPGVNLIQGNTVKNQNSSSNSVHEDFPTGLTPKPKSSWFDMRSSSQMSISSSNSERFSTATANNNQSSSFVITSCSPAWFELAKRTPNGPVDYAPQTGAPLPVWTSGKALWKAKAGLVLVKKNTKYYSSFSPSFLETIPNINVSQLHSQQVIAINPENASNLEPGTVIIILALKVCQFMTICSSSTGSLRAKGRAKSVNMLQCGIVGYKSLAKIPGYFEKALPKDMPFVYLPLDDSSVSFSPVAIPPLLRGQIRLPNGVDPWSNGGAHSILSLLSLYRMPMYVKPLFGKNLSEWLTNSQFSEEAHPKVSKGKKLDQSLIKLSSCYYGTLIFLEPLLAPENSVPNVDYQNPSQQSRFFVVTSKMLNNHTFLVADSQSRKNYNYNLKMHAHRVAQFLSACHPVYGLNYLFKYLENNSNFCNIGPPNEALTRTLGPPIYYQSTLSSVFSIAAMTSILTGSLDIESDQNDCSQKSSEGSNISSGIGSLAGANSSSDSGSNNEILNEIEEIYLYVRTGRLPEKKAFKKLRSHSMVNQNKIFVVQNPMPEMTISQRSGQESSLGQMILPENFFKNFSKLSFSKESPQKMNDSLNYTRSTSHLSQPKSPLVRFSYKNASFSQPSNSPQIRQSQNRFFYPCSASSQEVMMQPQYLVPDQASYHMFNASNQYQMIPVMENQQAPLMSPGRKSSDRLANNSSMASSLCSLPELPQNNSAIKNQNPLCVINEFGAYQISMDSPNMTCKTLPGNEHNSISNHNNNNSGGMIWMKRSNQRLDFDEPKSCCLSNLSLVCNQNSFSNQINASPLIQHTSLKNPKVSDRTNSSPDTGLGGETSSYFPQMGQSTPGQLWTPNFVANKSS